MKELSLKNEISSLLALPEEEREKKLATLDFHKQLDLVLSTPWEERHKIILHSPYAEGLVQNMPSQELFLTLKATSLDIAVELLSYAKASQIQFCFDIDTWYKDRIKPERVASWIILLFEAGEGKVLKWLSLVDLDFLVALLQKFIKVYKRPDDVDLVEAMDYLPPYTLDDTYFIEFKVEELEFYFRRIIEIIREEIPDLYIPLLEAIIWEIPAEVEERAYQWRKARIEEEGLFDYFDAIEVYSWREIKNLPRVDKRFLPESAKSKDKSLPVPVDYFYPKAYEEELFVFKVISQINSPSLLNWLKTQMLWLVTKLAIADHVVIDDIEQIKKSFERAWKGVNLGLEYLSDKNLEQAKEILENHFLEHVFQAGYTLLRNLKKLAIEIKQGEHFSASILRYLDSPYKEYYEGVSQEFINKVKLFRPEYVGTDKEFVFFSRVEEVRLVRRYLEEIIYVGKLVERIFGSPLKWLQEINKPGRNFDAKFLSWSTLILTALANWVLFSEFEFRAIPETKWKEFCLKIFSFEKGEPRIRAEVKELLVKSFESLAKKEFYLDRELLHNFLNFSLERLVREFKGSDPENLPSPKYQTCVLVELESSKSGE